ncbi:MAG: hypothetical protein H7312_03480 [Tardiphaga sp.]|nr:hypothetical protein [Tardiphaga sp.]
MYELFKDFQPAFAALVALGAATLAFRAAMSRVIYDAETARLAQLSYRLGLLLRLQHRAARLREAADAFIDYIGIEKRTPEATYDLLRAWPKVFDEVDEAWAHVELLPAAAVEHVERLRDGHSGMAAYAEEERYVPFDDIRPESATRVCNQIRDAAHSIGPIVATEIATIEKDRNIQMKQRVAFHRLFLGR